MSRNGDPEVSTATLTATDPAPDNAATDWELIQAAGQGDRAAFGELYDRHATWLRLRLTRRCASREVAEDVVQELFVGIWQQRTTMRREGDVAAWLWCVASRRLIDHHRNGGARQRLWGRLVGRYTRNRTSSSAEDELLAGGAHGDVAQAVGELPEELRRVLQVTVLDGLSTAEAAAVLGVPAGTVKTRAMRARARLRATLAAARAQDSSAAVTRDRPAHPAPDGAPEHGTARAAGHGDPPVSQRSRDGTPDSRARTSRHTGRHPEADTHTQRGERHG